MSERESTFRRGSPEALYYLVLVWFLAVLWRSAFVAMQPGRDELARSLAGALLLAVPLFVPAGVLPEASWWRQATESSALDASNPASEPVLALADGSCRSEALGALEDHTHGETDLYFVAFAPDGAGAKWRPQHRACEEEHGRALGHASIARSST